MKKAAVFIGLNLFLSALKKCGLWDAVLRGFRLEKCFPEPSVGYSIAQLLYVKSHGKDKEPCFIVLFPPCKESPEAVILFQNTENSLDLYRAVHAEEYASFG